MALIDSANMKEVLADKLGFSVEEITDDKKILSDLGADSLDIVEIVMGLESTYQISIDDDWFSSIVKNDCTVEGFIKEFKEKYN